MIWQLRPLGSASQAFASFADQVGKRQVDCDPLILQILLYNPASTYNRDQVLGACVLFAAHAYVATFNRLNAASAVGALSFEATSRSWSVRTCVWPSFQTFLQKLRIVMSMIYMGLSHTDEIIAYYGREEVIGSRG